MAQLAGCVQSRPEKVELAPEHQSFKIGTRLKSQSHFSKVPPPSTAFSSEEKKVFQLPAKRSRLGILRGCTPTEAFRVWTGERVAVLI